MNTQTVISSPVRKRFSVYTFPIRELETQIDFEVISLNPRNEYNRIDELAASIIENGLKMAIEVYKSKTSKKYRPTDGFRRALAFKMLKDKNMVADDFPVTIKIDNDANDANYEESLVMKALVVNTGEQLSYIEIANAVVRLKKLGFELKEIARKMVKEYATVRNFFLVGNSPKKLQNLVKDGVITPTTALQILNNKEISVQEQLDKIETELQKVVEQEVPEINATNAVEAPKKVKVAKVAKKVKIAASKIIKKETTLELAERALEDMVMNKKIDTEQSNKYYTLLKLLGNSKTAEATFRKFFETVK